MKKRAISLLLTLVLLIGILPTGVLMASAGGWLEDYSWDEESATLTIHSMEDPYGYLSGWDAEWYAEQIPWHQYNEKAQHVIIGAGVEKILPYTFLSFTQVKTLIIEDGTTEICEAAFAYCSNLISVSIPKSITSICDSAFFCCESLSSLVISEYVTNIETAFGGCTNLTELVIDENNPNYSSHSGALFSKDGTVLLQCFASNSGEYAIPDGVQTIGDGAFRTCDYLTAVSFPDSVTAIEARAFYDCEKLAKVILPESISEVGLYAFRSCYALSEVWIYYPQCSLGEEAFSDSAYIYGYVGSTAEEYCDTYGNLFIDIQNPTSPFSGVCGENAVWQYDATTRTLTISGTGAMQDYSGFLNDDPDLPPWMFYEYYEDIYGGGYSYGQKFLFETVVIEEGITTIGACAFDSCYSLKDVVISDSVMRIGDSAFEFCDSLSSISLPDSVNSIGAAAFLYCRNLSEVNISEGVERIESVAFGNCEKLSDISIPESVKHIGSGAFDQTGLYMDETNWIDGSFYIDHWLLEVSDDISTMDIPAGTRGLGEYAFAFSDITGVNIPETLECISDSAFCDCNSLTEIFIPESVTYIGSEAFSGCSSLAGIWVDEDNPNYSSDESGVLFNKEKTRLIQAPGILPGTYYVPNGVETMDDYAFCYCAGLSNIHIPSSTAFIAENAIFACWDLGGIWVDANNADYSSDSVGILFNKEKSELLLAPRMIQGDYSIPNSVTAINDGAFMGCYQLTSIKIPEGVERIGTQVFSACSSLTSIILPDSVTSIGDYAFQFCDSLESITLPESVTSIGDGAFSRCRSLTSVYFMGEAPEIGTHGVFDIYNSETDEYEPISGLTLYYIEGAEGWTTPTWNGYPTATWEPSEPEDPVEFIDVPENIWYAEAVDFAVKNGLFNGMSETTFEPDTAMTRAMLVTVLWRYAGQPEEGSNGFSDVPNNVWYTQAVAWASGNGVVNGVGNNRFDPDGKITREQLAVILYRYCKSIGIDTGAKADLSGFPDASKVSPYAADALSWAVENGLVTGSASGGKVYLEPQGNATRAQVATILMRFIQNVVE